MAWESAKTDQSATSKIDQSALPTKLVVKLPSDMKLDKAIEDVSAHAGEKMISMAEMEKALADKVVKIVATNLKIVFQPPIP